MWSETNSFLLAVSFPFYCFFLFFPAEYNIAPSITQRTPSLTLSFLFLCAEKPMPQGPPGGVIGILGGVVAIGLIIGVAVTVFMVHRRQQKTRTETDNDLWVPNLVPENLAGDGGLDRLQDYVGTPVGLKEKISFPAEQFLDQRKCFKSVLPPFSHLLYESLI